MNPIRGLDLLQFTKLELLQAFIMLVKFHFAKGKSFHHLRCIKNMDRCNISKQKQGIQLLQWEEKSSTNKSLVPWNLVSGNCSLSEINIYEKLRKLFGETFPG